eukprot:CAMPEP_0204274364 /NCGR_PEP_ID=MMETSP0468-20130131/25145_1 /ASSEMBLY_ACC=CAM_ASM_000383 /TAXON_ID=2969 /ORGANISM="Oxyrrhis marina" /LENGTH=109 /DNA_ID=CAMNT_0051250561 /DNA_START=70 /DNA_END=401 /DNA_ORIENTATION=-
MWALAMIMFAAVDQGMALTPTNCATCGQQAANACYALIPGSGATTAAAITVVPAATESLVTTHDDKATDMPRLALAGPTTSVAIIAAESSDGGASDGGGPGWSEVQPGL